MRAKKVTESERRDGDTILVRFHEVHYRLSVFTRDSNRIQKTRHDLQFHEFFCHRINHVGFFSAKTNSHGAVAATFLNLIRST